MPVVPPEILGFEQVSGELHITSVDKSGAATILSCPGQENSVRTLALIVLLQLPVTLTLFRAELRRRKFYSEDLNRRPLGAILQWHILRCRSLLLIRAPVEVSDGLNCRTKGFVSGFYGTFEGSFKNNQTHLKRITIGVLPMDCPLCT